MLCKCCYHPGGPKAESAADGESPSACFKASGCLKASKASVPRVDCLTFKQVVGDAEGRENDILTVYQQKEGKISS